MFFCNWHPSNFMVNGLKILAKSHKRWVTIARSFGLDAEAEDLVQDMYLKVHAWQGRYDKTLMYNETEVNYYFVFIVLKNLFNDKMRKNKKTVRERNNYLNKTTQPHNLEYNEQLNEIKKEIKSWHLYDRKIYELIYQEGFSMLELSKKTGIDYYSIYRTKNKIDKLLYKILNK